MEQEFRSKKFIRRVEQEGKQVQEELEGKIPGHDQHAHNNALERKGEKQVQEELEEEKITKILLAHCLKEHQNGRVINCNLAARGSTARRYVNFVPTRLIIFQKAPARGTSDELPGAKIWYNILDASHVVCEGGDAAATYG